MEIVYRNLYRNTGKGAPRTADKQNLGIYGSFRPMIWFFIILWTILGLVALGGYYSIVLLY